MAVRDQSFQPLVQPAAAPQLLLAQMDSSLATISLGFDQTTNEVRDLGALRDREESIR